jgi:transcriptional regulator of met regulon
MAAKLKRHSMTDALRAREDIVAFLEEGRIGSLGGSRIAKSATTKKPTEKRIAVTLRLPLKIAHALIDQSAQRRKNREQAWSQQDIVAEALEELFHKFSGSKIKRN